MTRWLILATLAAATLPAQADGLAKRFPVYPGLEHGREVWLGTCRDCHDNPMSPAPQAKNPAAWAPRIAKGRRALLHSALNGFTGIDGEEMPPRGANPALSDTDVGAALDYMLKLASPN